MENDIISTTKSIWEDVHLSADTIKDSELSELYYTKILPSQIRNEELCCKVAKPELVNEGWFGYKSYYEYEIISNLDGKSYTIKRRFREFEEFHNMLIKLYPGFNIPALPSKSIINYHSSEILSYRRSHIEFYLNYLASHFLLKKCDLFSKFLSEKDFLEPNLLKNSSYNLSLEQLYDKKLAELSTKLDLVFRNRHLSFDEEIGDMFNDLQKTQQSLEFLESLLQKSSQLFKDQSSSLENLRQKDFCPWIYELTQLEDKHKAFLDLFSLEISKELLKIKGLLSAINILQVYKIKSLTINKLISRKQGKFDLYKQEKYKIDLKNLDILNCDLAMKIHKIQENIEQEYKYYQTSHTGKFQLLFSNLAEKTSYFYSQCSLYLLQEKHKNQ